jgi:hypothetical protein
MHYLHTLPLIHISNFFFPDPILSHLTPIHPNSGAHAVDREFRVMGALYRLRNSPSPVPVPRPFCFWGDSHMIGTPFFCYDYVEGRFFKSPRLDSVRCESVCVSVLVCVCECVYVCVHWCVCVYAGV